MIFLKESKKGWDDAIMWCVGDIVESILVHLEHGYIAEMSYSDGFLHIVVAWNDGSWIIFPVSTFEQRFKIVEPYGDFVERIKERLE